MRSAGPCQDPSTDAAARRLVGLRPAQLVVIGLLAGLLSGLLGVGGGIVMVPLLVLWSRIPQRHAHAVSLGAIVPISIAGVATYGIGGHVRWWDALALSAGSIAGARVGTGMLARISDRALKVVFGIFLVVVAAVLVVQ